MRALHEITVTGAVFIYNDPEGGTNQEFGVAPKPVQSFWVTPSGEERFQVWSGPGQAHSFCDRNGGEVGIDLVAHVKDVPDRPGWANAFVLASLFESTSGTCGGSDNEVFSPGIRAR